MKRLSQFVARLYPRSWRERYGAEFSALLEDLSADWRTSADILKGVLEMRIRAVGFAKIFLAVGLAGVLAAAAARFAIPQRAEAVLTVSGPADDAAAGDAVMSLAGPAFRDASLTSVTKMDQSPRVGDSPAFRVAFTYDDRAGQSRLMDFVHEHARQSGAEEPKILAISSHTLNPWLVPLIGPGVSGLALALLLVFKLQASKRTA